MPVALTVGLALVVVPLTFITHLYLSPGLRHQRQGTKILSSAALKVLCNCVATAFAKCPEISPKVVVFFLKFADGECFVVHSVLFDK